MTLFHLILLALIQGITEFLPVSSSGHLVLLPALTGMPDQGQFLDVSVHLGTLGAVVLYFWADVRSAILGVPALLRRDLTDPGARLAFLLIIATIPAVAFGLFLKLSGLSDAMRSIKVIGWTMLIFGIVLWWADTKSPQTQDTQDWNIRHAVIMGLWQAVALVPGTSRSGITITGARFLGYARRDAARLSMLMSIPTILASGALLGVEAAANADLAAFRTGLIAATLSFVAALGALALMMRLLNSSTFTPYVIYRVILGIALLGLAYSGTLAS